MKRQRLEVGMAARPFELRALIDQLRERGFEFDAEPTIHGWRLLFDGTKLSPRGRELLQIHRPWFVAIAVGRRTGHAIAFCSVCGEPSMVSIVNTSGTSRW